MRVPAALSALAVLALLSPKEADGAKVTLYLFYGRGCHSCMLEKEFLAGLAGRVPELEVVQFEAMYDEGNAELLAGIAEARGVEISSVPATFVGPFPPVLGFDGAATSGRRIEELVRRCVEQGCEDPVGGLVAAGTAGRAGGGTAPAGPAPPRAAPEAPPADLETVVELPLLGETDLRALPLVALTVVVGALDGFNPCAFFVLFTLLGVIVHARSRRRMALVGGTFVLCSGLFYFLFMAAWLNLFRHVGEIRAVTVAAGFVALGIAAVNIKDYFLLGRGVSLSIPEGRKPRLFERMRALLHESSAAALLLGTVVLAVAANTYELLCTAGFPMIYTRILTLSGLRPVEHYLLLALYNAVYVLPLAAVVVVFVATLGSRKLTERQARTLKLVSGLMMLGLGLVVLVDPSIFGNAVAGVALLALVLAAAALVAAVTRRLERATRRRGRPRPPGVPRYQHGP